MTQAAPILNPLLRGVAIGVLLLIAAMLWREPPRSAATRLGALVAVSVAAATLASMPGFAAVPSVLRLLIAALAPGGMFLFWLFTRALFDDAFALRPWHAVIWVALAAAGVANCAAGQSSLSAPGLPGLRLALGILPVGWALLSIAQSLTSWREDLIDRRRELRTLIVATTTLYTVAQLMVALLSGLSLRSVMESTANAGGTAVLALFVGWRLLRPDRGGLFEVTASAAGPAAGRRFNAAAPAATAAIAASAASSPEPTPLDLRHIEALETLLSIGHLHREPGLNIRALAERMALPEHKLRRLINQGLGHRNFSAFLNTYRLADARRWLADPAQRETPILTIAMDAGFQSIGPFNRAFKADTGMTPSEFRRLGGRLPAPECRVDLAESGIG